MPDPPNVIYVLRSISDPSRYYTGVASDVDTRLVLTMFASQHSDRLSGLVYLDGASDPTSIRGHIAQVIATASSRDTEQRLGRLAESRQAVSAIRQSGSNSRKRGSTHVIPH
jgi:hypothetical protein